VLFLELGHLVRDDVAQELVLEALVRDGEADHRKLDERFLKSVVR
jgi:hypothetical protein